MRYETRLLLPTDISAGILGEAVSVGAWAVGEAPAPDGGYVLTTF